MGALSRPPDLARLCLGLPLAYPRTSALVAGALTVLAFAPFDLFWLPLLTLALWMRLLGEAPPGRVFQLGWLFGVGFLGTGVSWLHISIDQFGNVGTPLAILFTLGFILAMALYYGLVGWLIRRLASGLPGPWLVGILPAAWILGEWLRGWVLSGFPWLALGYSQVDAPLGGYAPLLGVYGVSGLLVLSAALLLLLSQPGRRPLWGGLLVALWLGGGLLQQVQWTQPAGAPLRVSLVQANIPQALKWDKAQRQASIDRYLALTRAHWDSQLVIWPETAVPDFLHRVLDTLLEPLGREAAARGSALLVGIPFMNLDTRAYYNAAFVLGTEEVYFKRHLVPLGEFLPFKFLLGPLLSFMEIPMSDFSAGAPEARPLVRVAGHLTGVSICYEDAFGEEVLAALPEADVLVNLSNDAWFGDSLAPHQHLQIARLRALETGRPLLRATNTGISALIGPRGQLLARSGIFEETVVTSTVQPMTGMTPYARLGNGVTLGLSLLALGLALRQSKISRHRG